MTSMMLCGLANRTCFALIVLLCLCVGMQMLGLPVMIWDPWEESDTSENLDFSIPSSIPRLNLSSLLTTLEMTQQDLYNLLLLPTVFRPPKSPQELSVLLKSS
jgi:hypothetical protein